MEKIEAADDVGLKDIVPRAFDRIAAEMEGAVDAFEDRLDLRRIGQLRRLEFFASAEIGGRPHVAQQQVRIDRGQQLAQGRANFPRCAGQQYAWHSIPRFAVRNEYGAVMLAPQVAPPPSLRGNGSAHSAAR